MSQELFTPSHSHEHQNGTTQPRKKSRFMDDSDDDILALLDEIDASAAADSSSFCTTSNIANASALTDPFNGQPHRHHPAVDENSRCSNNFIPHGSHSGDQLPVLQPSRCKSHGKKDNQLDDILIKGCISTTHSPGRHSASACST
jgi:hypothetical protein